MAGSDQKTEQPTARRVLKARSEGQFAVSREFVAAMQFLTFVALLSYCGPQWFVELRETVRVLLRMAGRSNFDSVTFVGLAGMVIERAFAPLGRAGLILVGVTLGLQLALTRGGMSLKKLTPDISRFSPGGRIKEIFGQAVPNVLKALCLLVVFSLVVYWIARDNLQMWFGLPLTSAAAGMSQVWGSFSLLLWRAASMFLVLGVIDLIRQKKRFMKDLKMSRQEIKEEMKESEGNPQIKARIRRLQRDLLRRRMMSAVPTATAVIVNPTHYAVAIRYEHSAMGAPVVVAKGKNYLALRIKQVAIDNKVPLIENKPLAQGLYKAVDVGQEIPPNLYHAVAEVLAYVYKLMRAA